MLKLTIGGILCFICAYLGIVGKQYYDKRYRYLRDYNDFLLMLSDGISYSKDRLPYICKRYVEGGKGAFCSNLKEYIELIDGGSVREEDVKKCFEYKCLKKSDKILLREFFVELGKFDYDTQLSKLESNRAQLSKALQQAEKDSKTTGQMLAKLGFVLGIAIMIILA